MKMPPAIARPRKSRATWIPGPRGEKGDEARLRGGRSVQRDEADIEHEEAHDDCRDRGRQEDDPPAREPRGDRRAERDADREDGEIGGDHLLAAAKGVLDQGRQEREDHRADQPEPADHQAAAPDPVVAPDIPEQARRRAENVALDDEVGRLAAALRDAAAREPGEHGEDHDHGDVGGGAAALGDGKAAGDGAEEDREKGGALDQSVARGQLVTAEIVGQEAILDRPEKSGEHAEEEEGKEEDGNRIEEEA